jgi:hypothetical protein
VAACVYVLTRPALGHNSDVYRYVAEIRAGDAADLFNVHHLLYGPMGFLWTRALSALGVPLAIEDALRLMNALFGALAVVGFFRLTDRLVSALGGRLAATAGFAFCFAIWIFSVDVEVYVPSTAFLIFSFLTLDRARAGSRRAVLIAGALYGLGALFHQMGILFGAVAAVLLGTGRGSPRERLRGLGLFFAAATAVVLPPYLWAGVALHGVRGLPDLLVWVLGYSLRGYGEGWGLSNLADAVLGHGRSLVFFEFVLRDLQRRSALVPFELALVAGTGLALLAGTAGAVLGWRRATTTTGWVHPVALLIWYLVFAVFAFWWEPENPEFWVTAMVPFWALWAGGLWHAGGRWRGVLLTVLIVMFASNLTDILRRKDVSTDPEVMAVLALRDRLGDQDVILLPPVLDAKAGFFAPDLRRIGLYPICKAHPDRPDAVLGELESRIEAEISQGHRIFYYSRAFSREVLDPHPWCVEVEPAFEGRFELVPRFEVHLPVDDDEGDAARRVARWQEVEVYELSRPR